MYTVIALCLLVAAAIAVEVIALRRKDDDWPTITALMRKLRTEPWVIALIAFVVGLLFGHFWG
jgi:multisubunit Na+/H+ antiporter MnhE subunit